MSINRRKFFGILPGLLAVKEVAAQLDSPSLPGMTGQSFTITVSKEMFPLPPPRPARLPREYEIWALLDENNKYYQQHYICAVDPYKEGDPYICKVMPFSYEKLEESYIADMRGFVPVELYTAPLPKA